MIQIVGLFLIAMVAMAIFGRLRRGAGGGSKPVRKGKCRACGRHRIGSGPCPCGKGD
jgi:hypothetical protein